MQNPGFYLVFSRSSPGFLLDSYLALFYIGGTKNILVVLKILIVGGMGWNNIIPEENRNGRNCWYLWPGR